MVLRSIVHRTIELLFGQVMLDSWPKLRVGRVHFLDRVQAVSRGTFLGGLSGYKPEWSVFPTGRGKTALAAQLRYLGLRRVQVRADQIA